MKINPKNTKDLQSMGIIKKGLKIKKMLSAKPEQNILVSKQVRELKCNKRTFPNL
jgi:hypothetical protein